MDPNLEGLREKMVQEQLLRRGIQDERLLNAFRRVPRHLFVLPKLSKQAYGDYPIEIGFDQTISQPYMVALMTHCLRLEGPEKILEVGTGSGYQTAILAELTSYVFTVERVPDLAAQARHRLETIGYRNISFSVGDGSLGWPQQEPFDGILVSCAAKEPPQPLLEQLKKGKPLVIPIGGVLRQTLTVFRKSGDGFLAQEVCSCVFVPLVGDKMS